MGDRVKALAVNCNDKESVDVVEAMIREGVDVDSLRSFIKENKMKHTVRYKFYQKGEDFNIDEMEWKEDAINVIVSTVDNTVTIIRIDEVRQPEPKTFKEVRGHITSGYQAEIEKIWLQSLRDKYPVKVNTKILNKIAKKYNQ